MVKSVTGWVTEVMGGSSSGGLKIVVSQGQRDDDRTENHTMKPGEMRLLAHFLNKAADQIEGVSPGAK